MGEYDFTYQLPKNFHIRVVQYLEQFNQRSAAKAFQRCEYEYEDVGLAYYSGLRGDNWNKKAVDFTLEGDKNDISLLKSVDSKLKDVIGKTLKSSETGYLLRKIFYLDTDVFSGNTKILSSNEERLNIDIAAANSVLNDLIQIGERVCLNNLFNYLSSENNINDYFRDMLFAKGYDEVKDQTRHGVSVNKKDAAEVDILLTKDGKEIAIFEGLKLNSVNATYIDTHIHKAIINYNALGTATFVVAYVGSENFESFWERYYSYIQRYEFPIPIKKSLNQLVHPNAATRIATLILTRDGFDFPVYFVAIKLN